MESALDSSVARLTKDQVLASETMTIEEARFAVDQYYMIQQFRIQSSNMISALQRDGQNEPHLFLDYQLQQLKTLENQSKRGLAKFIQSKEEWPWLESVKGIGPVLGAGLHAHIDVTRAPTAGAVWRFAGYDPTAEWKKGQRRPHNASLKTLCWKIGESFVKIKGYEDGFYGHIYAERRKLEGERNDNGNFADQAAKKLERFKITDAKTKACYESGKLPDGHLHSRAKRYAVKLFLAHYHEVMYEIVMGCKPPKPYIIEHGGHVHKIEVPR